MKKIGWLLLVFLGMTIGFGLVGGWWWMLRNECEQIITKNSTDSKILIEKIETKRKEWWNPDNQEVLSNLEISFRVSQELERYRRLESQAAELYDQGQYLEATESARKGRVSITKLQSLLEVSQNETHRNDGGIIDKQ